MDIGDKGVRNRRNLTGSSKTDLPVSYFDLSNSSEKDESKSKRLFAPPQFSCISVVVLVGICILFAKYMDERLPKPLMESDVATNPYSFIEERARRDLELLISVGPRVSGSEETDVITVENFLTILDEINKTKVEAHYLEYEIQRAEGAFLRNYNGPVYSYSKISNVIVKLEAADESKRSDAFLLNCHFDSKQGSPGATDNMISCSVMLEIIRVISRDETALPNTIIFLFNGAEEQGMQGSNAFIDGTDGDNSEKGHRWSKNIKAFLNLEGAGAGGREILFQTGPGNSWVLKAYTNSVPHPYGTCLGEEAFQRGLVPSYTDFKMFKDLRKIPGLDMAFIKNGWVYHTKWDRLNEIPPGSIQHMGENTLALVREFGQIDLQTKNSDGKSVFFDVLGGFMIRYSEVVGITINVLVGLSSVAFIYWREVHKKMRILQIVWLPVATIISWGTGILAAVLVAIFLNGCGYYKPFFSYPSLSFVVFGVPAILGQIISFSFAFKGNSDYTWIAGKLTTAVVAITMTFVTRVVYLLTITLIFGVFGWFLAKWLCRGWPRAILLTYLAIGEFIPFLMSTYLLITVANIFVPIMGHNGQDTNANLFFGVIVAGFISVVLFNGLVHIFTTYKKSTLVICFLISFFLINPMIVFGFVGKIPYQEKTPLRLEIADVDRTWYEQDLETPRKTEAGYWIIPTDSNTKDFIATFKQTVLSLKNIEEIDIDSDKCVDLYCGQPLSGPISNGVTKAFWIPKVGLPQEWKDNVSLVVTDQLIEKNVRRMKLSFSGPTQLYIVLSPNYNYHLTNWSIPISIPYSGVKWKGRSTYFIFHGNGFAAQGKPFEINCEFKTFGTEAGSDPVLDVQLSGFYLYGDGPGKIGSDFWKFTNEFPHWTHVMSWTSVVKLYTVY